MKRTASLVLAVFLLGAAIQPPATAAETDLALNIGDEFIEGRVNVKVNPIETPLRVGGGFIINEKDIDYWLANVNFALQDEVFTPALNMGLGLKFAFGTTDFLTGDLDTLALPFEFLADYDFRKSSVNIPVSLLATIAFAPKVLSFSDTEEFFEFYTTASFHINNYAAVYLGYRRLDIDYEKGGLQPNLSDDVWLIGVKFTF